MSLYVRILIFLKLRLTEWLSEEVDLSEQLPSCALGDTAQVIVVPCGFMLNDVCSEKFKQGMQVIKLIQITISVLQNCYHTFLIQNLFQRNKVVIAAMLL